MTQEDVDEVMWNSTPEWQKEQLREEQADLLWEQKQEQLREDYEEYKSEYEGDYYDSDFDL